MSYKAKTAPWELTFWKKKIKPAAGRSDLCKQAANAAVTPEDAVIQRSALMSAVQVEIWSVYVPYKARTAPWELTFWKKKIKPAAGRSDLCKQAANAAVTPEDAVIQRSALMSAVQVEIWSVYVPYKARTASWELTFWPRRSSPRYAAATSTSKPRTQRFRTGRRFLLALCLGASCASRKMELIGSGTGEDCVEKR